jgi:hypothetical protein
MSGGGGGYNTGQALPNQVQKSYTDALNTSTGATGFGADALGQAGGIFSQMGGYTPSDVQAGQLADTNLDPYMNPYTRSVTDQVVGDINEQEAMQQQALRDTAENQGSFGGSRMDMRSMKLNNTFDKTRADAINRMYSENFQNAQRAAQQDIAGRFGADSANQDMRQRMFGGAGTGFSNLGQAAGGLGDSSARTLGNLSQQGWGMAKDVMQNQSALGGQMQDLQQQIINAAKGQYGGYTNSPTSGLEFLMRGIGALPSGVGTQTTKTPSGKSPLGTAGQLLTLAPSKGTSAVLY